MIIDPVCHRTGKYLGKIPYLRYMCIESADALELRIILVFRTRATLGNNTRDISIGMPYDEKAAESFKVCQIQRAYVMAVTAQTRCKCLERLFHGFQAGTRVDDLPIANSTSPVTLAGLSCGIALWALFGGASEPHGSKYKHGAIVAVR